MNFPLSLDLRNATLARNTISAEIIDANGKHVMTVHREPTACYDQAGAIVDALNLAWAMQKALKL